MVAKLEGPQFSGGANIAIKCPSHTYEQTVAFYRDTLGLPLIEEEKDGCIFQFGPNRLWIDDVPNLSHPDVWLELETNDTFISWSGRRKSKRSWDERPRLTAIGAPFTNCHVERSETSLISGAADER